MDNKKVMELLEKLCDELGYRIYPKYGTAIIPWNIEDVNKIRPDLSDDEADEVLNFMEDEFDASVGMNWDTLEMAASECFPLSCYPKEADFDILYKMEDGKYCLAHVYYSPGEYEYGNGNWRSNIYRYLFSKEEIIDYETRETITEDCKMKCEEHKNLEDAINCCHKDIINADEYYNLQSMRKYKDVTVDKAIDALENCKIGYAIINI